MRGLVTCLFCGVLAACSGSEIAAAEPPFTIEVVDAETGRGVPLVELETVEAVKFVTDSAGLAAIPDLDLQEETVHFRVFSHGYEYPADGFGIRGKAFRVQAGKRGRIELRRRNIAERLVRLTGPGIYRDSIMAGREVPLRQPLLNAKVFGSDSVNAVVYRDRVYWFWGDTNRPSYPLGNYNVPGATSELPARGGLSPEKGVEYTYFVGDDGFARPTAAMPGPGPTWIGSVTVLPDAAGKERMVATYVKIRDLLVPYAYGIAVWNDDAEKFEQVARFDLEIPFKEVFLGHTFRKTETDGREFAYFCNPYPFVRVKATVEAFSDPRQYEGLTCLVAGTNAKEKKVERGPDGAVKWGWKRGTPPLSPLEQADFVKQGLLKPAEALTALRDPDTGRAVMAHAGSVHWNEYRKRWVMIAVEQFGESSYLGEVWYAEAPAPSGPWTYGRKILTHEKYTFYNPKHHPFFDRDGGRTIHFEGTYTHTFSGTNERTPRYDYNQMLYRLDLADPRVNLPVPIVRAPAGRTPADFRFLAWDRPGPNALPIQADGDELRVGPKDAAEPLFFALPADLPNPPPTTVLLHEFRGEDGKTRRYAPATDPAPTGYRRIDPALCRVWIRPQAAVNFPLE